MSDSLVRHDGLNVCEVKIDQSRKINQIRDTGNRLLQDLIRPLERFRHGGSAVYNLQKLVVRNHDQRIDGFLQLRNTGKRIIHANLSLKTERLRNNTHGQDTELLRYAGNDRSRACAGSSAHATRYEYHIRPLNRIADLFRAFLGSLLSNLGPGPSAKAFCNLFADLDDGRSFGHGKCLLICIDTDELNTGNSVLYHAVYSIIPRTAYADNDDPCAGLGFI